MEFIDADEMVDGISTLLAHAISDRETEFSISAKQKRDSRIIQFADFFSHCAIRFVLAHEFSHMLMGHLEVKDLPQNFDELIKKSHQNEVDADHLASNIVGGIKLDTDSDILKQIKHLDNTHPFAICGALFFMRILSLLENILELSPSPIGTQDTHPPAKLRLRLLRDSFQYINRAFDDQTNISNYDDGAMIFDDAFKITILRERFDIVALSAYKIWGDNVSNPVNLTE
jgi:hypothetical protein